MSQTYYLRNTTSDLAGGLDFNYKLLTAVAGEATATIQIAKSATEESYGFTEPNIPNNADWETGTTVVKVKVTAGNTNIWGSIRVDRVSAAGALVESSTTTAEQQFSSVATYTFTVASKDWTAGTIGDRLRVAYIFRNAKVNAQSFDISYNTSDSSIVTSVITEGHSTKTLQYVITKSKLSPTLSLSYALPEDYDVLFTNCDYWTINNPVSASNYQHKFTLPWKAGMQSDFRDVRFAQVDGTHCSYWIESYTSSTTATIWIKIPSSVQTVLKVYYGNDDITSASSGNDTFILFDHFDSAALDTTKWSAQYVNTSIASSQITIAAHVNHDGGWYGGLRGLSAINCSNWVSIEASLKQSSVNPAQFGFTPSSTPVSETVTSHAFITGASDVWYLDTYYSTIKILDSDSGWHRFTVIAKSGSSTSARIDSTTKTGGNALAGGTIYAWALTGTYVDSVVDWIFIRQASATEPTFSPRTIVTKDLRTLQYVIHTTKVTSKSLEYVIEHYLYTIEYDLKYVILTVHTVTKNLQYSVLHLEIAAIPPVTGRVPINIEFHATTETGILSSWTWTWDFDGDLGSSTAAATSHCIHQFLGYGEYDIVCTAATLTASASDSVHISLVEDLKPVAMFYMDKTTGDFPLTVRFYNYSSGAVSYDWNFGDGTAHSGVTNPTHVYTVANDYTITLTATNAEGDSTYTAYITFTAPIVVADFQVVTIPGGRLWEITVSLTVTDIYGTSDTMSKNVMVSTGPFTRFRDLSTGKIKHWEWDFGD
jgi:PKD repeat protein